MTAAPATSPLYLVICGNHIPEYTAERELRDMTWAGTVKDIADLQFPSLNRVIEIGTGRDVTAEMVAEAGLTTADVPLTGQALIDWRNDHARDQRKQERV
jgi:hypothetical protein